MVSCLQLQIIADCTLDHHPILYLNNKQKQEITHPQTIELQQENRIIVISGPNAGGKTISLKTVGLLQLITSGTNSSS
jgi:dsDNA-specific endonuclease/ATPase MutS2